MNKLAIVLLTVLAAGCSRSLCERAQASWQRNLRGACDVATITPYYQTTCDQSVSVCVESDRTQLNEVFDCLDLVAPCEKGHEAEFLHEVAACNAKGTDVSDECARAVVQATTCDRAEAVSQKNLQGTCSTVSSMSYERGQCESGISSCSKGDLAKAEAMLVCFDGLGSCETATQSDFQARVDACFERADGMSNGCRAAVGARSKCEQAADLQVQAINDACAGKSSLCWFCDCQLQGKTIDAQIVGSSVVYSCKDNPTNPNPTPADCEGSTLANAEQCLQDVVACIAPLQDVTRDACGATPK